MCYRHSFVIYEFHAVGRLMISEMIFAQKKNEYVNLFDDDDEKKVKFFE